MICPDCKSIMIEKKREKKENNQIRYFTDYECLKCGRYVSDEELEDYYTGLADYDPFTHGDCNDI